ncbi:MAG TPA: DUF4175 family protein [Candidatus Krumholzibacteria bacterium]|nr:DUF4175 family protein [Candidatus Krumholzibacteria bacterium]
MKTTTAQSASSIRLKARLRAELKRLRLRILGNGFLMLLASTGLVLAAGVLAYPFWPKLGPAAALICWGLLLLAWVWVAVVGVFRPLRLLANLRAFSRQLEHHGSYANLLETATQFSSTRAEDPLRSGASSELVEEILRRACLKAEATALAPQIPLLGVGRNTLLALLALSFWFVLALSSPARIAETMRALSQPQRLADRPPESGLYAVSGDLALPVGATAELRARDLIGGKEAVVLQVSYTGDYWQDLPTEDLTADPARSPYLEIHAQVRQVEDPFRYRFRKGTLFTKAHEVRIVERPVVRDLAAQLIPPAYTGLPTTKQDDLGGTTTVLSGTTVILQGRASVPLGSASRVMEGKGEEIPFALDGAEFSDTLRVDEDLAFSIALKGKEGISGDSAIVYRFNAVPDEPPSVRLTAPAPEYSLDRDLVVQVEGLAADDVGLHQVDLLYKTPEDADWRRAHLVEDAKSRVSSEAITELQIDAGEKELALAFTWHLGEVQLFPGDLLSYCLEAVDNDALVGGQRTKSLVQHLRLPTVAEVLTNQRSERSQQNDQLKGMLDEGEQLQQNLDRLRRELLKNPKPDWTKQQEIEKALEDQKAFQEKALKAAGQMNAMLEEFQKNNSGSLEMLQKMETIQELLEKLKDANLDSYLKAMKEAMDKLSPSEMQNAMEDAANAQEEWNRRLDRSIELLRKLEREHTMDDLMEETAEALSRQEKLQRALDQKAESAQNAESQQKTESQPKSESSKGDSLGTKAPAPDEKSQAEGEKSEQMSPEEVARLQKKLAEQTEALEKRLQEELQQLKEQRESGKANDPSAKEMQDALEDAQKQMNQDGKASDSMKDASDQLQNQDRKEVTKEMQEAMDRLISLYKVLAEGKNGMTVANKSFAIEKLQQTAYDLLRVSFEEEQVVRMLDGGIKDQRVRPITRQQARLTRGTSKLSDDLHELSKKNFLIGEKLLQSMRDLVETMETSTHQLEYSRPRRAHEEAETSMGMMNKIVIGLLTAAEQQGQGSGSGSSASQQMKQMAGDQSRLNSMTKDLQERMRQGLSPEERGRLAQLHAMQEQIKRQLDELRKSLDDKRRVLGDLDQLSDEMQHSARDLQSGRLDSNTRERQDRILSRLLDAERSVRERDFAKRRESKSAEQLYQQQEGTQLSEGREDRKRELRRWLAPDAAPREYQDEVRRYFRRIQDELSTKGETK